ncbi:MAG: DUF6048 family protein [Bacteroidales bacterium]
MRRIFVFFISLLSLHQVSLLKGQDSILVPLKLSAGFDIFGPVFYFTDKNILNIEGFFSVDRNEKMSYVIEAGYTRYKYEHYNYDFRTNGVFLRAGVDFNLLQPEISKGRYRAGIGLRYGMSLYESETSSFYHDNYWGRTTSSIPAKTSLGHFLEVVPGVKTELFNNVSIGWSIRLKLLISAGTGKDLRPVNMPGFGNATRQASVGFSYFLTWHIPYKNKMVRIKVEEPEEEEEEEEL